MTRPWKHMVRWMMTQWCNYRCSYCYQDHSRHSYYRGSVNHWADAASPAEWLAAFGRHFESLSLHLSGGEPMLDVKNTEPLLEGLLGSSWFVNASIDTNLSFRWGRPDPRLELNASFHPEHRTEDEFLADLAGKLALGWRVLAVSYVAHPGRLGDVLSFSRRCPVPVNVIPRDWEAGTWTSSELATVRRWALDGWKFGDPTLGLPCSFPTFAYEMEPDGRLFIACHRADPSKRGSLFADRLPELPSANFCPKKRCVCEEKYQWLGDVALVTTSKAAHAARIPVPLEVL